MKLLIKKSGIFLLMLLYSFILIPFDNGQVPFLNGSILVSEINEETASDLSSIQIYFSEFNGQIKIFSESEDSNKQKKNLENQFHSYLSYSAFTSKNSTSKGTTKHVKICNSQTDFNYVAHTYW